MENENTARKVHGVNMTTINLTSIENPVVPEPGIYYDVPWDEYRGWNAFSKSMVSATLRSGKHLEAYIEGHKKTSSMHLGSLLDCLLLEPGLFQAQYAMQPSTYESSVTKGRGDNKTTTVVAKPWNKNSHTCQAIAVELHLSGKQIVSNSMYEKAVVCRDSLLSSDEIRRTVESSRKQVSIAWHEPNTGVLCKARFDMVGDTIDDLKTSVDASAEVFSRQAGNLLYHVQAGAYTEGWFILTGEKKNWRFIVVETGGETLAPLTAIYKLDYNDDSDSMLAGRLMFRRACEKIIEYQENGFRGYSDFAEPFSVPRYVINSEMNMHEEIEI